MSKEIEGFCSNELKEKLIEGKTSILKFTSLFQYPAADYDYRPYRPSIRLTELRTHPVTIPKNLLCADTLPKSNKTVDTE